ncbi:MAG: TolC family protein [Bacteroidales bacterium]|nr:TolC family protein [Bacteroidales bacterium]
MRKLYSLVMSLCMASCFSIINAQTVERRQLGIKEMFELAEENNRLIKMGRTAVMEAQENIKVAESAFLPSIEASLSLSYNGDGLVMDRNFSNAFKAEIPSFGNNFAIEVSQVIYAGGTISNSVKMSELQAQLASLDADRNRQEVRFLIIGNYLELCKLENQLKVFDMHIEQTQKVLDNMRLKHEQGTALHNDITRYELKLQNLEYTKTQLNNSKQIINNQLTTALGLSQNISIITDSIIIDTLTNRDIDSWNDAAQSSALPIQIAEKVVEMSEHKVKLSNSERLPKIALFAFDNLNGPVTIEIPALNNNFNYWGIGVGISYNFDRLYKSNKNVRADRLGVQKANEKMEVAKEQILLAMQSAHIKYMESYSLLNTKEKSLELANQNYEVVNYRYNNGLALITDLLDASSQKLEAELQVINTRINILYNYYKLHYISGTL